MNLGSIARSGLNSLPGVTLGPPPGELPSASALDNARLNAFVVVPNALQGLFRRRRRAVAAATAADVDRWAVGLLSGMRRTHRGKPVWVRLVTSPALLLFSGDDIRTALDGSPEPFAPDPEAKRKGMSHFQPGALTISRGTDWAERRRFAESVLDTGKAHRLSDGFARVVAEEVEALLSEVDESGGELDWDGFALAARRITRRIVLGDSGRDDEELADVLAQMMDSANSLPDEPSPQLDPFLARIGGYIRRAEAGSLLSLFADAPLGERVHPVRQVTHWLFAMGDTLAINAFRALAATVSHPEHLTLVADELSRGELDADTIARLPRLEGCLEETMRLWPTTPMLARELTAEVELGGASVPAGTQVVVVNTFMHRDRDRRPGADRFNPGAWRGGKLADDWTLNHFSHGAQGCPGSGLALFVGKGLLGGILRQRAVTVLDGELDPKRPMPHMLDFFALRFRLEGRK